MEWLPFASKSLDVLVRAILSPWTLGVLLCAVAVLGDFLLRRRWVQCYEHACFLVRAGQIGRAVEMFQSAARWSYGPYRTGALAGVGICYMQQSEYVAAAAVLEPLMTRRLLHSMRVLEVALPGHFALCLAMLGDTRRAKHWLEEAWSRCDGVVSLMVLPEVAILCRDGHVGMALKMMEDWWEVLRAEGLVCNRLRLFRAYAQRKVDPERNADLVFMTLLSLAPFPKEELAFCREHWPVLADFMGMGDELVARHEAERASRNAERALAFKDKGPPKPEDDISA
ncbi:hypothetical protein [Archangium sp.]|uniref:hypothetical protein n=1 Tax=Archangium sp. TaxID=1872627 RepID=UPI002D4569C4|nr:hypothetical protein [Archangium sp.]HYO54975.1 hypothetical protein [Archangium sp.]